MISEKGNSVDQVTLGGELRRVRRASKLSQLDLAAQCGLHTETIAGLERDRGTVASLTVALAALEHWFEVQYNPHLSLGEHLEERRRKLRELVEGAPEENHKDAPRRNERRLAAELGAGSDEPRSDQHPRVRDARPRAVLQTRARQG
ncbi:helix-turn-helix domain-containing protein [Methylobacterium phyllosphaerae]